MLKKNISRRNLGLGAAAVALTACSKAGTEAHARVTVADNNLTDKVMSDTANTICLLYTSPSPRDGLLSRMPSSA